MAFTVRTRSRPATPDEIGDVTVPVRWDTRRRCLVVDVRTDGPAGPVRLEGRTAIEMER